MTSSVPPFISATPVTPLNNPVRSFSLALWNANGLRVTTIHDVLSHALSCDILLITETWLTSGLIPTDWSQYHLYGQTVTNANGRGSGGVTALISPHCPFTVSQLPSYNAYTLSIKVDKVNVHCVYFPPSLSRDLVLSSLNSLPLHSDTIICGDFNARLGDVTGDSATNPRGLALLPWIEERNLSVLNSSLAYGIDTYCTFRNGAVASSIIDLFLTNIGGSGMVSPSLSVASDLSLGSDHRLLQLGFEYIAVSGGSSGVGDSSVLAPRRTWNLSRLAESEPLALFHTRFRCLVAPLKDILAGLVGSPPDARPPIDSLNASLNECLYQAMDASIGSKAPRPGHWKKYWTADLEAAARERDRLYCRWRHSFGVDKAYYWHLHLQAHKSFRRAVAAAKRLSWKNFRASLEKDFTKATATMARLKRRKESTATYSHPDGPQASVDTMASHLASVYNGSLLVTASRPSFDSDFALETPYMVDDEVADSLFSVEELVFHIKKLPNRKAPGPDHIKAEMLKAVAELLAPVLSLLFLVCFQWSYTPLIWRQAQVFPIFKKGDADDPANYRPISLTSVMRKLFEISLSSCLYEHSPALDLAQGGFRPQRSPLDQALCLHDLMHDYFLAHHHYPVVAFLDIKAAYDTVDRRVIWDALANSSLPRAVLGLLVNLFDDVSISVLINNHSSAAFAPATGVLQGSVLSPHLYSLYINSLPGLLRSTASATASKVSPPGTMSYVPVNCLLFADDVAIFGSKYEVQEMLDLAADHSKSLGYRWNPTKCAVLNAPSVTSSTSTNFRLTLYGVALPSVDEFTYLGMPFSKKGLFGPGILAKRSGGAIKTMALLNSVGVNRNGFSLLLCARLYTAFIRPKFEYGLAISRLSATDFTALDQLQNRLVGMFVGSRWFNVAKHLTCIPSMKHRYNVLVTKYALRSQWLPDDCLVSMLNSGDSGIPYTRLEKLLKCNPMYLALPSPVPTVSRLRSWFSQYWQNLFDDQMAAAATSGRSVLLRACRPCTSRPDPILYLPMSRTARSRLVRWRLGRFTNRDELCPCFSGSRLSRDHFVFDCRGIDPSLFSQLPDTPPDVNAIDHALNCLPTKASAGPPPFWPALLELLYVIDTLCHPLATLVHDPDPGDAWFAATPAI
jgi:hypothetical protein